MYYCFIFICFSYLLLFMNVCMYVCMYVCMHVYIYTHIHTYIAKSCQFVVIFAPFSVGHFINFGVSKCRQFYVEYNKKYVTPCKYIYFAYNCIYISKCRNFDLPSSSSIRNRSKNSLVSKTSFILVKFNHFSSFQNKLEVSITIFRFMGNI